MPVALVWLSSWPRSAFLDIGCIEWLPDTTSSCWPTLGLSRCKGRVAGIVDGCKGNICQEDDGLAVNEDDGPAVGEDKGPVVGEDDGPAVGEDDGPVVGEDEGLAVDEDGGPVVGEDEVKDWG